MIFKIILLLAALFAIYWTFKLKKLYPAIISMGMITGIVLSFIKTDLIPGAYIYQGFVALAFVYGFTVKNKKIGDRIIICLMSASIFIYWVWVLNHWHGNTLLFPIVTLLAGLAAVIRKVKLKNELGFLVILMADAIAILLENWFKAI